ncbi:helix-turn-helix domain-containing protein [Pseudomonas viridiflava]|uniref:helix-turn-helix domain-containing protein n=1 Tax=Pseudomonas viridiflava TaxID=33069 RepID=UPI001E5E1ACE|nr:helix-turn-helix domain-containing protein [Pseudomonas viridiflava]
MHLYAHFSLFIETTAVWPYAPFWTAMTLTTELAATLRAIRQQRGLSYSELSDATFRTTLSLVERGKAGIRVGKLADLAAALDFDLTALIALCVAVERGESAQDVLTSAALELQRFTEAGGLALLQEQLKGSELAQRSSGQPVNVKNRQAVLELKAQGKTQSEIVRVLGLSRSSVQRYWHAQPHSGGST